MSYSKEETSFYDYLRKKYFGSSKFKKKIISTFEKENYILSSEKVLENTSFILQSFIKTGNVLWTDISNKIEKDWIQIYQKETEQNKKKFPEIYKLFNKIYKKKINSNSNIEKLHNYLHKPLSKYFSNFCFSNKQFAKNLAGTTFENHIQILLEICQYKYERQKHISSGQILDFVYPSLKKIKLAPSDCIVSECQSTLKDRFRLSLGKIPPDKPIKKYIFTGGGLNVITSSDDRDISPDKVKEIKDKGWILVVFDKVKKDKYPEEGAVISYEQFFNRVYPALSGLWD